MAAHAPAAYGMYTDDVALRQVVQSLNQSGFDKKDICVMLSPEHPIAAVVREAWISGAGREASTIATGLVSWFMKLGAVMIPTVGFFVRSQSFLDALLAAQPEATCDAPFTRAREEMRRFQGVEAAAQPAGVAGPDPLHGKFTLAEATKDVHGSGPLTATNAKAGRTRI